MTSKMEAHITFISAGAGSGKTHRLTEILHHARQRAEALGLSYAGAFTPAESWAFWRHAPGAKLVDVRTRAELDWVGRVPGAIEIPANGQPVLFMRDQPVTGGYPVIAVVSDAGIASLAQLRPEFFDGQTLLVWCGEVPSATQQQLLTEWRENGYPVYSLGPDEP